MRATDACPSGRQYTQRCVPRSRYRAKGDTRTSVVNFPLGPYHPALSEPYALLLRLNGEHIVRVGEPVGGYGHRGILTLLVEQPLEDALVVIERICAQAGQAYRLALSLAVERATHVNAPRSAQLARVFFAELEMMLSALWTLNEITSALNLQRLRHAALEHRERLYMAAREATGELVYWGVAQPGGVRQGIEIAAAREALTWLPQLLAVWRAAMSPTGSLRRAASQLDAREDMPAPSVSALATAPVDARRTAPYDGYRAIRLDWSAHDEITGDAPALALYALRLVKGLKLSHDIMRACADALGTSPLAAANVSLRAGQGSATVQTAHGPARIEVAVNADGRVTVARLETRAVQTRDTVRAALLGRSLRSAPALLAGIGVCPSCADL